MARRDGKSSPLKTADETGTAAAAAAGLTTGRDTSSAMGLVQPKPEELGLAPVPEPPGPAGPPPDPSESNRSCSFRSEGRFKGGGTESLGPALCELRGRDDDGAAAAPAAGRGVRADPKAEECWP